MPQNHLGLAGRASAPVLRYTAAREPDRPQSAGVSAARGRAADELGAAMAHELNDPLTALLLYLHSIKDGADASSSEKTAPDARSGMIDMALAEAEHICAIVERMGRSREAPTDAAAVALGREVIDMWQGIRRADGADCALPSSSQSTLTPREHEVLNLIVEGHANKEGAYRLGIAKRTFEVHRARIMDKFGAKNAADLVRMTLSDG